MSPLAGKKFDYKWVIVGCCFAMMAISMGFCSSTKQLFVEPVTEVLGIKRGVYALNTTFRYITNALVNLMFGTLLAKLGVRKMLTVGFAALIGCNVLFATAQNVFMIYGGAMLLGFGLAMCGSTTISYIIHSRFNGGNVGTVMGFTLAANGFGGAIALKVIDPIIGNYQTNPNGWRSAYWTIAILIAIVGIVILCLYREKKDGFTPPAKKQKKARGNTWDGLSFAEAKKKPYFILTMICLFLTGFVLAGINGISLVHMKASVVTESNQAFIVSVWAFHSLALMFSKFLMGFLYDKCGLRIAFFICQGTAVLVMIALSLVENSTFGLVMGVIYAIFSSLALPMETVGVSLAVGDIFGSRDYARILGLMTAVMSVGFAVGDPIMNAIYDWRGTYVDAIRIAVFAIAFVSIGFQIVIKSAYKDRDKIIAERAAAAAEETV